MKYAVAAVAIVLLLAILGPQALFTVDETQLVVVTRFGEIQEIHTTPGLKVKAPFLESVNRFDKRLLRIDVPTESMPDKDQQFLEIDAYVRYRINDPRKFLERLRDEFTAADRIGRIVISELRRVVAASDRTEIIGGIAQSQEDGTLIVIPSRYVLPDAPRNGIVLNLAEMRLYYYPDPIDAPRRRVITHPVSIGQVGWSTPLGTGRALSPPSRCGPRSGRSVASAPRRRPPALRRGRVPAETWA